MTPILSLMRDLDAAIAHASIEGREATMRGVTDLLVCDIERLSEEQVAIVEEVIARLAPVVGRDARAELARRLAPLPKAPSGIVRSLARDDIEVARPVLVHSLGLADADLVAVATAQGIDHRQAIAERRQISEVVTDVLVARGDRGVLHALARNAGARWSKEGAAVLADRARDDAELQQWLELRPDAPAEKPQLRLGPGRARGRTFPETTSTEQRPIERALPRGNRLRSVAAGSLDYRDALDTVGAIALLRPVDEEDVAGLAEQNRLEEAICAIAASAALGLDTAERLFTGADANLILIVSKAKGWSWETLRSLLGLRDTDALLPHNAKRFAETFEDLDAATAERVLRGVTERDHPTARAGAAVRPVRT